MESQQKPENKPKHVPRITYGERVKELAGYDRQLREQRRTINEQAEKIGTLFEAQKKLIGIKQKLTNIEEPVLFLTRTSGEMEIYHKVKGDEFYVPNLPTGIEKKILLGQQWQNEIPYAGKTFRGYWCHEDYAFPHKWSKPNIYQGKLPKKIRDWITDPTEITEYPEGIPILLENANTNSEALRDKERKTLIAWEKLKTNADAQRWVAYGKALLYVGLAIAAVIFVLRYFSPDDAVQVAQGAATTITNTTLTGGIQIQ